MLVLRAPRKPSSKGKNVNRQAATKIHEKKGQESSQANHKDGTNQGSRFDVLQRNNSLTNIEDRVVVIEEGDDIQEMDYLILER